MKCRYRYKKNLFDVGQKLECVVPIVNHLSKGKIYEVIFNPHMDIKREKNYTFFLTIDDTGCSYCAPKNSFYPTKEMRKRKLNKIFENELKER
jgi:hypothetical protein